MCINCVVKLRHYIKKESKKVQGRGIYWWLGCSVNRCIGQELRMSQILRILPILRILRTLRTLQIKCCGYCGYYEYCRYCRSDIANTVDYSGNRWACKRCYGGSLVTVPPFKTRASTRQGHNNFKWSLWKFFVACIYLIKSMGSHEGLM